MTSEKDRNQDTNSSPELTTPVDATQPLDSSFVIRHSSFVTPDSSFGSSGKQCWRSLEELASTEEFHEMLQREFPRLASEWDDPVGRRRFLKLMGASLTLAGLGACTRQPPEAIAPYVRQPEEYLPGSPLYFASRLTAGGGTVRRPCPSAVVREQHFAWRGMLSRPIPDVA